MTDLARLRHLVATIDAASDADLLDRFVAGRDGPAFAALVRRHGPMVLAVCRRVLRHRQDAEDAFQATFLVLARRAEAVKPRSLLGNWLYGVAYRTALSARRVASARRAREARAAAMRVEETVPDDGLVAELRAALDRELAALPDAYRAAVVACDLEGLQRRDAAVRLGWSEGTLSSRLARARALLARRLARYGLAVPTVGLAVVAAPAAVARELIDPTVRFGKLVAVGEAAIAAPVAALMEGTMRTMFLAQFKALAAATVVGCAVAVTALAGWRADAAGTADPTQPEAPKTADAPKRRAPTPDKEQQGAPRSDKERIAELERERDQLLKMVAKLQARLEIIETERNADRLAADARRRAAAELEAVTEAAAELAAKRAEEAARAAERNANRPPAPKSPEPPAKTRPLPPGGLPGTAPMLPAPGNPGGFPPAPTGAIPPLAEPRAEDPFRTPPHATGPVPGQRPGSSAPPFGKEAKAPKAVVRVYSVAELAGEDKDGDALVKVLRAVVEPKSWGADAGVEYLPGRKVLVVRQTPEAHDQVNEVLSMLRSQKAPANKK